MPRNISTGWAFLVPAASLAATVALGGDPIPKFAQDPPPIRSGEPSFQFNGRNLDGFSTFLRYQKAADPAGVFGVRDGTIRISGAEVGSLITTREFADYHLIAEWRWGRATHPPRRWRARNSGVLVHCVGAPGDGLGAWMESVECQILEGGSGDLILVPGLDRSAGPRFSSTVRTGGDGQAYFEPAGSPAVRKGGRLNWWGRDPGWTDVLGYRGARDLDARGLDWNRTEVVCDGDRIEYRLNGVLVNAASGSSLRAGKILLQSEGAEIEFRRFEVRPLIR